MIDRFKIDPKEVWVEEGKLEQAETFVSNHPELDETDPDVRSRMVENIARMVTAIEASIFMSDIGTRHAISFEYTYKGIKRSVLAGGIRTESGVSNLIGIFDSKDLEELLGIPDNTT